MAHGRLVVVKVLLLGVVYPSIWRIERVSRLFSAGTTSMAEGIAALQALRWAHSKGLKQVQILLDARLR